MARADSDWPELAQEVSRGPYSRREVFRTSFTSTSVSDRSGQGVSVSARGHRNGFALASA